MVGRLSDSCSYGKLSVPFMIGIRALVIDQERTDSAHFNCLTLVLWYFWPFYTKYEIPFYVPCTSFSKGQNVPNLYQIKILYLWDLLIFLRQLHRCLLHDFTAMHGLPRIHALFFGICSMPISILEHFCKNLVIASLPNSHYVKKICMTETSQPQPYSHYI